MRILNGLSLRTALYIPSWILSIAESWEFRKREIDLDLVNSLDAVLKNNLTSFSALFDIRETSQLPIVAREQIFDIQNQVLKRIYPARLRKNNTIYSWFFREKEKLIA